MRDAELAILMGVTFGAVAVAVRRTRFAAAAQRAGVIAIGVTVERGRAPAQLACSDRREPLALGGARRRERRRSVCTAAERVASLRPRCAGRNNPETQAVPGRSNRAPLVTGRTVQTGRPRFCGYEFGGGRP